MKTHARFIAALCGVFMAHAGAIASDLPRSDPDRAAILQAARPAPDVKFIVKDLRRFDDFAFLCALETTDGAIIGTDDDLDVHHWTFVRHAGTWLAIEAGGGFARDARHVSCAAYRSRVPPSLHKIERRQDVIDLTVDVVKEQIRSDLDDGHLIDADAPVLRALESKNVLGEIPIEHEKAPFSPEQLDVARRRCATRGCVVDVEKAFDLLAKAHADAAVGSLVWEDCKYGLRAQSLMVVQRCVSVASRLPYCRPGMTLDADRKEIAHCLKDIRAMCEKDIPGQCN